jgi:hypothetical protein
MACKALTLRGFSIFYCFETVAEASFAVVMFIIRIAAFLRNSLSNCSPSGVYLPCIPLLTTAKALTANFGRVIAFRPV